MTPLVLVLALAMPAEPPSPVAREIHTTMGAAPDYVVDSYCHVFRISPRLWLADYPKPVRAEARSAWTEVCRGRG